MNITPLQPPSSTRQTIIHLENVCKDYPTPSGAFRALTDVSFNVLPGEFVAIIGKSGAGKTTLVNMITGVDHATSGVVEVAGADLSAMNETSLSQWRGRTVGVIYQAFHLLPGLSLLENVMLPMDFCRVYRGRASRERAYELLRQVGLVEHAKKLPSQISGGQQQRVAIARALANDPPILMADEPTGRLDSMTATAVFEVFETLVQQGKTIMLVTHDRSQATRVPRQLKIADGRIGFYAD
jgi:putative ABC transport system ATP-binding protein